MKSLFFSFSMMFALVANASYYECIGSPDFPNVYYRIEQSRPYGSSSPVTQYIMGDVTRITIPAGYSFNWNKIYPSNGDLVIVTTGSGSDLSYSESTDIVREEVLIESQISRGQAHQKGDFRFQYLDSILPGRWVEFRAALDQRSVLFRGPIGLAHDYVVPRVPINVIQGPMIFEGRSSVKLMVRFCGNE